MFSILNKLGGPEPWVVPHGCSDKFNSSNNVIKHTVKEEIFLNNVIILVNKKKEKLIIVCTKI